MNFICHNWIGLVGIFGVFVFGALHGFYEDKMQPALFVVIAILLFSGFGFGAAIKGITSLFVK